MKVLIVDDDPRTTQLIEDSIPWKDYDISEVYTAYHGEMALNIMKEQHPDIIFSDIEMPQMDGIQMLEMISQQDIQKPEVVFLTCHDDFSYIQKALRFGAADYLLKPFRAEELLAVLLKIVLKCRKKQTLAMQASTSEAADAIQSFMNQLLNKMLIEDRDYLERILEKRRLPFNVDQPYYLVYAGVNQGLIEDHKKLSESEFYFVFRNLATEIICDNVNDASAVMNTIPPFYTLILPIATGKYDETSVRERCQRLISVCDKYLEIPVSCVVSDPVCLMAFGDKKKIVDKVFLENRANHSSVMLLKDMQSHKSEFNVQLRQEKIGGFIQSRQKTGFLVYLKFLMTEYDSAGYLRLEHMRAIHHDLMQVFYGYLYENHIQANLLFQNETFCTLNKKAENSAVDMIRYASYLYDCTVSEIEQIKESDSVIWRIKWYIEEHYNENIGRDEIAQAICVAPTYLSKLFHDEVGMSLREYINSRRIEQAKKLLVDTNDNVSDIAMKVGFENIPYFSTVFKKYCKMTPFAWKNTIKGK